MTLQVLQCQDAELHGMKSLRLPPHHFGSPHSLIPSPDTRSRYIISDYRAATTVEIAGI